VQDSWNRSEPNSVLEHHSSRLVVGLFFVLFSSSLRKRKPKKKASRAVGTVDLQPQKNLRTNSKILAGTPTVSIQKRRKKKKQQHNSTEPQKRESPLPREK
jgi:hypothetical protein